MAHAQMNNAINSSILPSNLILDCSIQQRTGAGQPIHALWKNLLFSIYVTLYTSQIPISIVPANAIKHLWLCVWVPIEYAQRRYSFSKIQVFKRRNFVPTATYLSKARVLYWFHAKINFGYDVVTYLNIDWVEGPLSRNTSSTTFHRYFSVA